MCEFDQTSQHKRTMDECQQCAQQSAVAFVDFACKDQAAESDWLPLDTAQDYCSVIAGVFYSAESLARESEMDQVME